MFSCRTVAVAALEGELGAVALGLCRSGRGALAPELLEPLPHELGQPAAP
jgi:hypothetical protein